MGGEDETMTEWIAWLGQHAYGKAALLLTLIYLGVGGWRWWRCRQRNDYFDLPLWGPLLLGLASPLLILKGLAAGWERFDRELAAITTLEAWEGLRALDMVHHATSSFFNWSTPLVSAGMACFLGALLATLVHSVGRFDLFWRARKRKPNELQEIREELRQLRQLLETLTKGRGPEVAFSGPPSTVAVDCRRETVDS